MDSPGGSLTLARRGAYVKLVNTTSFCLNRANPEESNRWGPCLRANEERTFLPLLRAHNSEDRTFLLPPAAGACKNTHEGYLAAIDDDEDAGVAY